MVLTEGDFVSLDFTGKDAETGQVFDTTNESVAKEHGIHAPRFPYGPMVVCIGEEQLLAGLEQALAGKPEQGSFTVSLAPEQAFGKKQAKLIKLMPLGLFRKQGVLPAPGVEVDIDGVRGVVKHVSGNRVIVDFNHPLAGRSVEYEVETHGTVTDPDRQVAAIVGRILRHEPAVTVADGKATVTVPIELPADAQQAIRERVIKRVSVTDVSFSVPKRQAKQEHNA